MITWNVLVIKNVQSGETRNKRTEETTNTSIDGRPRNGDYCLEKQNERVVKNVVVK